MRQAVVLVGGKGTRLGEITRAVPKPLLEIEENVRFIDYLLDRLARHGVEEILLLAGHLGNVVERYYHGRRFRGARVEVIQEPAPAGTGGALLYVGKRLDPTFLMLNGDSLFDFEYALLPPALQEQDIAALALRQVDDGGRYGTVNVKDGRILDFREKRSDLASSCWISAGTYALRREILDYISSTPCSIESEVFPALAKEGRIAGRAFNGYFIDIGLPNTLEQARRELPSLGLHSKP
nr:sugar phosphate nucleotidyltransferase [Caulobacter sp. CCUG 60055]